MIELLDTEKTLRVYLLFVSLIVASNANAMSDHTRAHIKCYANLSHFLFEGTSRVGKWEQQRMLHWDLAVASGRKDLEASLVDDFRGGKDIYLGGYIQRVYDGQAQKLWCNDPSQYGYCPYEKLSSKDAAEHSKVGMEFYKSENCGLLLK